MSKTRKWYAKGLYLVFALALLVGLSVTPVSASSVSEPSVTVSPTTISTAGKYTISFTLSTELVQTTTPAIIYVRFPTDTTVPTGFVASDITLGGSSGVGSSAFSGVDVSTVAVGSASARTVTITLDSLTWGAGAGELPVENKIGALATLQLVFETAADVLNPSTVGDYTLEVKTAADTTWKTSASYSTTAPAAGVVSVYNASDVLMASFTGATALDLCQGATPSWFSKTNYTIEVSAATYTPSSTITISGSGLTFKSTDGAASTIIDASASSAPAIVISIAGANVVVGGSDCGFTIKGGTATSEAVRVGSASTKPTVQGNVTTGKQAWGILTGAGFASSMTIKDNTLGTTVQSAQVGMWLIPGANSVIDGNEVSGFAGGISLYGSSVGSSSWANAITVSNNECHGNFGNGIGIDSHSVDSEGNLKYVVVSGNDCYDNTANGIDLWLCVTGSPSGDTANADYIKVVNNTLYDNEESGLRLWKGKGSQVYVFGNSIYGNTATVGTVTGNDYGIMNYDTSSSLPATHNWWGDATGPSPVGTGDALYGSVTSSPWLEAEVSAAAFAHGDGVSVDVGSLDAKTTVGVQVSGVPTPGTPWDNAIGAALYTENPKGTPTFTVVENSYTDVYVDYGAGTPGATNEVIVKFSPAGVDENSVVHAWNETYGTWEECTDQDYSPYAGGYVWVKVHSELNTTDPTTPTIEALAGLPFVVSTEAVGPDEPADYDEDGSGLIEIDELLNAISDYIGGVPGADISLLLEVISAYINETAV